MIGELYHPLICGVIVSSPVIIVNGFKCPCPRTARAREECEAGADIVRIVRLVDPWSYKRRRACDREPLSAEVITGGRKSCVILSAVPGVRRLAETEKRNVPRAGIIIPAK